MRRAAPAAPAEPGAAAPGENRAPVPLGIVVPALNAESTLGATLAALAVPTPGLDCDIVVVDGGSEDATVDIAQRYGARIAVAEGGRGPQLIEGVARVFGDWLLILHADTRPPADWPDLVESFARDPANAERAGYFRLALDAPDPAARRLERFVAWRARALGLPYGDQGLLLRRGLYAAAGGYPAEPLMEDVALVRRLGRRRLVALPGTAVTSAARYEAGGYLRRGARNLGCLALYVLGVPPRTIRRLYG